MNENLFITIILVLMLVGFSSVSSSNGEKKLFSNKLIENLWIKNGGWPQIFDGGSEDTSIGISLDSHGNVIVTGYSYNLSTQRYNFVTIKYNPDGNEIWRRIFDSGVHDIAWDMDIDPQDNIVIIGISANTIDDIKNFSGSFLVVKYDNNGVEQWHRIFRKQGENNFPLGISTDLEDNIIITGGFGSLFDLDLSCWTMKMNKYGDELWNRTFHENLVDLGMDVDVNKEGDIIVTGIYVVFPTQGFSSLKYDVNGNLLWKRWYDGVEPFAVKIDDEENIYMVGHNWSDYTKSGTWYVIKCNREGMPIWINEYDSGFHDGAYDVSVDSKGGVFVVGFSSFYQTNRFEHCMIVYDQNGKEVCIKRSGVKGTLMGVDIDKSRGVVITGLVENLTNRDYYTSWYTDFSPPAGSVEKPKKGYLYLFDKKMFQTPRNKTIVIGDITIGFSADEPSDIERVEFYINSNLKGTIKESPYEWVWNEHKFGKYLLRIMVYDHDGTASRYDFSIWKLL